VAEVHTRPDILTCEYGVARGRCGHRGPSLGCESWEEGLALLLARSRYLEAVHKVHEVYARAPIPSSSVVSLSLG